MILGHDEMALMQPENIGILAVFITISCFIFRVVYCNCDSEIYCRGPILEKIQMSGLFADSKQFVDMPTSKSKAVVIRNNIHESKYFFCFRC